MSKAICLPVLFLSTAALSAAESTTVTWRIDGRQVPFGTSLKTEIEGLAIALLGSCHTETTLHVGTKEHWNEALKGNHILVTFTKPRLFSMSDQQDSSKECELRATEILIPIGRYASPEQIYVRSDDHYRTFSKYEPRICDAFQKTLQHITLPRVKPPAPK